MTRIITIQFWGAVDLGQRRRALPFIWETLATQPAGFTGKVDLWDLGAPDAVELIWVNRGKTFDGVPYFKTQTTGYVLPLATDRIGEKLQKSYQCAEPLDLLAYVHWGELAHANAAFSNRKERDGGASEVTRAQDSLGVSGNSSFVHPQSAH